MSGLEYRGLASLRGPLASVADVEGVGLREHAVVIGGDGQARQARVVSLTGGEAVLEVFGDTTGLALADCRVRFAGHAVRMGVGPELVGRVFDGQGRPRDGLPAPVAREQRPIDGAPINPCRREYPRDFLETGISAIDGLNSVVLGQKIPIFSEAGLPHDALALQIVRQARIRGGEGFVVVFAAMGLPRHVALEYEATFRRGGALRRMAAFLNVADDPAAERLMTPRVALTAAEYLAFDLGLHVLVVLHDMTNYGEALREASAARGEMPSRKGYPGYLYSDLASIFERAGRIRGRPGSITQIPIVTMPSGDITHPIPDLTGYVTEGQIVLDRGMHRRGIYPPIALLPSLSRLMHDGIGEGRTRADHGDLARQLYAVAARAARARALEAIIGRDELSELERRYLAVGDALDRQLVAQRPDERRAIADTLDRGWAVLRQLPAEELTRVPPALLSRFLGGADAS